VEAFVEQGANAWAIRAFRELDDALLRLRINHLDVGQVVLKTEGSAEQTLEWDRFLQKHAPHWAVNETLQLMKRVFKRLDLTAKTGSFDIGAGQTLGGGGTVQLASAGTLNVLGLLSPGNSPGLLTFDAGTTILSGTTLMEISGLTRATDPSHGTGFYDAINVVDGGTLTFGGLLQLAFSQQFADNDTFNLFSTLNGGALAGNFTGVNVTGSFYSGLTWTNDIANNKWTSTATTGGQSLEFNYTTGTLVIVPEPAALALAGLGIAVAAWARRRK